MAADGGPLVLSDLEQEAIVETFNIDTGLADSALSEMVGSEVTLSAPEVQIVDRGEAARASDQI